MLAKGKQHEIIEHPGGWGQKINELVRASAVGCEMYWRKYTDEENIDWFAHQSATQDEASVILRLQETLREACSGQRHAYDILKIEGAEVDLTSHDLEVVDKLLDWHTLGVRVGLVRKEHWSVWSYGISFFASRPSRGVYTPQEESQDAPDLRLVDIGRTKVHVYIKMDRWQTMPHKEFQADTYWPWLQEKLGQFQLSWTPETVRAWSEGTDTAPVHFALNEDEPQWEHMVEDILHLEKDAEEKQNYQSVYQWIKRLRDMKWPGEDEDDVGSFEDEGVSDDDRTSATGKSHRELCFAFEAIRELLQGNNPALFLVDHEKLHWSKCMDPGCLMHIGRKGDMGYFPKVISREKRTGRPHPSKPIQMWHRDAEPTQEMTELIMKEQHVRAHWRTCHFGSCMWHQGFKIEAGYWPGPGEPGNDEQLLTRGQQ